MNGFTDNIITNMKRQVFYSFHYGNDVMRVAQIRNIGALEDNKPVSANEWEEVKRKGQKAIENWIDDNMRNRSCVIVLIGEETANRHWVRYEIEKAWNEGRGVVGIYIHNINDPRNGKCRKGRNPFDDFTFKSSDAKLSSIVKCYDPSPNNAYNDIRNNLEAWVEEAIEIRKKY